MGYEAEQSCAGNCTHFDVIRHFDFRDGNLGLQSLELRAIHPLDPCVAGKEGFLTWLGSAS